MVPLPVAEHGSPETVLDCQYYLLGFVYCRLYIVDSKVLNLNCVLLLY